MKNNVHGHTLTALTPDSIYFEVVLKYLRKLGIFGENMGPHVMRATAATNALDNGADICQRRFKTDPLFHFLAGIKLTHSDIQFY
jgi:hypothetical protein